MPHTGQLSKLCAISPYLVSDTFVGVAPRNKLELSESRHPLPSLKSVLLLNYVTMSLSRRVIEFLHRMCSSIQVESPLHV